MEQNELSAPQGSLDNGGVVSNNQEKNWSLRHRLGLCGLIIGIIFGAIMYGFHYIDEEFSEGRLKVYDKRIMKDLRQAIEFYRSEYGKLPFSEAPMEVIRSEGEWLSVIMNESDDLNPKGFRFFDPPPFAKTAKGRGLHKRNGELSLTDIWGRMYMSLWILMAMVSLLIPKR